MDISIGNLKIGKDTLIINMGSATECASKKAGLCDIDCYALKSENMYKNVLPFRQRQEEYWLTNDAFTIAEDLSKELSRNYKTKIKYIRVNEAGDFHSFECIEKLIQVAEMLPDYKFYTYTHRSDLVDDNTHKLLPKNLTINTSDFKVAGLNSFNARILDFKIRSYKKQANEIRETLKEMTGSNLICNGDCSKCSLCKITHTKEIFVAAH
jgi:hypothetical protein